MIKNSTKNVRDFKTQTLKLDLIATAKEGV